MKSVVIDTDIIVDYLRAGIGPLEQLLQKAGENKIKLYISAMTVLELYSGRDTALQLPAILAIEQKLEVVGLSGSLAKYVAELKKKAGNISLPDVIIGGTAMFIGAEVATRNKKHFALIPGIKFY